MLDVLNPLVVGMPLAPLGTEPYVKEILTYQLLTNLGLGPACFLHGTVAEDMKSSSATGFRDQAVTAEYLRI